MTAKQLVALLVRLGGLYLALEAITVAPQALDVIFGTRGLDQINNWWLLTIEAMWAAAAVCMIAFPLRVAGNWLAHQGDQPLAFEWSHRDIEAFAIVAMGLYFSLDAVRTAAYNIAAYALGVSFYSPSMESDPLFRYWLSRAIPILVQLAIGLWLLFGAAGLRQLLRLARRDGSAPPGSTSLDLGPNSHS
jgi:hypothetical protein